MSIITANAMMGKDERVPLTTEDYDSDLEGEDGKTRYSNRYNRSPEGLTKNKPQKSSIKRNITFVRIHVSFLTFKAIAKIFFRILLIFYSCQNHLERKAVKAP